MNVVSCPHARTEEQNANLTAISMMEVITVFIAKTSKKLVRVVGKFIPSPYVITRKLNL